MAALAKRLTEWAAIGMLSAIAAVLFVFGPTLLLDLLLWIHG